MIYDVFYLVIVGMSLVITIRVRKGVLFIYHIFGGTAVGAIMVHVITDVNTYWAYCITAPGNLIFLVNSNKKAYLFVVKLHETDII